MRSKGKSYPELENYLYEHSLSIVTIRDYIKTVRAVEKNPFKAKTILGLS